MKEELLSYSMAKRNSWFQVHKNKYPREFIFTYVLHTQNLVKVCLTFVYM